MWILCREDRVRTANTATRSSSVKRCGRTAVTEDEEWTTAQLSKDVEEDVDIGPLLKWKEDGVDQPAWSEILDGSPSFKTIWAQWDCLHVENLGESGWETYYHAVGGSGH
ncbi:hypothetical protein Zmor_014749 [Zophobas morio]|uniref:Uncharacterized protein n=1 Tax=Zophobas morio TaxID=2755281 RepID=A0AA38MGU1_9CUCU|nr:hypothetical protein Zmor_014749 [Zophobas morio]